MKNLVTHRRWIEAAVSPEKRQKMEINLYWSPYRLIKIYDIQLYPRPCFGTTSLLMAVSVSKEKERFVSRARKAPNWLNFQMLNPFNQRPKVKVLSIKRGSY